MKKIYMLCTAGASSSLIVKKMQDAAEKHGLDVEITAAEYAQADYLEDIDMILIAPQARIIHKAIVKKFPDIPVQDVDMISYGMINGEKILLDAMKVLQKYEEEK